MAALLSDADVGFGAAPKLLSDADVGFAPLEAPTQSLPDAVGNAVGQGAVSGTGAVVSGAGRVTQEAGIRGTKSQLAVMDAIDRGERVPQDQDVIGYQFLSPEQRAQARQQFSAADEHLSKREPNALISGGEAIQGAASKIFPVAPENEGFGTGVGRMVGGVAPALAATAAGGPLAGAAVIGAQAYDQTYKDAISSGAAPEDADKAAGKSAAVQALTMALPVGRLVRIPASLRDGLAKTLVNLGQNGIEFGSANAVAAFANNYVAQQTYDPNRSLTQGTGEAAAEGAIAGLIIPAVGVAGRTVREGISAPATPADIMKAPDIDSAIVAATQASEKPDAASLYREAPAAIPPNAQAPILPRILDLINQDNRVAANRPDFIPPDANQPSIPTSWSDLFSAKANAATAPEPASVGAAASRENTPLAQLLAETPAQKATALQKMVTQSAEDRLTPQGRDDAVYVPGVERPESMRDFTPAGDGETSAALAHKVSYNTDTSYHDQFDGLVKKNNAVMVDKLNDMIGDANARDAAMNEAKQLMPGPVGLFDDEHPVNAQPIVDRIHEILAGPAGKRGAVESQLNSILPKLFDADGNLESLPSMLKGVRDDITDRLYDKSPTTEGNAARTARNQLQDVLSIIDDTIGSGLPGTKYQDYLTNLSAALGQVSKLDYLQKFLTGPRKLTDLAGNLQFNKVQKMLEDIQAHQADRTGGAKELTWPEINQIEAVRNELAAKDLLDRRAAVRGSPTAQITNAAGVLGGGPLGAMVKGGAEAALHVGLAATTHGIGNAALGGYRYIVKPMMDAAKDKQAAAELAATKQRLLSTDYPAPQ